jgi:nicotinate phosphoribosyltransferase
MKATPDGIALLADLYELTMAASYLESGMADRATFSLFIRKYPVCRSYFVAAGLEDFLEFAANFELADSDLAYLEQTGLFSDDFLDYLQKLHFTGDVVALAEGEIFFKDEPALEVSAPIVEAQIVETFAINAINFQSVIASKAARCVHAAAGRQLVDFSLRRTQGIDAGLKVARSSYIAGFAATSNVLAGKVHGIPVSGTMAHAYVSSFGSELEAFRAFARSFPERTVLLIDTYDTLAGARNAATVGQELAKNGYRLVGVRLDSGDIASLSQGVREILDEAGLADAKIFASSSFDEHKIERTLRAGASIDAFGVGTRMGVSADAPYFDMAYKLVQYGERPIRKLSTGKINLAGEKQVFRTTGPGGRFAGDVIGTRDETIEGAEPLLEPVMKNGALTRKQPSLDEIRERFKERFSSLDETHKASPPVSMRSSVS